ncbi:ATP-dependent DNA helicase RecG [Bordetella petrii]|uniref:ATP-dependent DNA helicase RecG n=1 Tax=Bordetella petrii (strain ATCC BAA-461 / DSM 12804 / CCUG 43448 / CIP 107267 / Se-1111R) TaxID=340100 RepID=A9ILW0_BORPD|nr:ATP-dependent DNA helicase RecG [Bordetella petrii]CAP42633.1 ATP-dependent DNA helicase [Bordetella petrii]
MPAATAAARKTSGAATGAGRALTDVQRKLHSLGLVTAEDCILHLPLRYEDETRIVPIGSLRPGATAQVEGEILRSEVLYRPRRQLTAVMADDSGELQLRWLNFYPSQQKQLAIGRRLRARGEVRGGLFGREIVHPRMSSAETPLPDALTPVYPSTDGLPQPSLRKAIGQALQQANLDDTLPPAALERYDLMPFAPAIRLLHAPPPGVSEHDLIERGHPAWRRIKFDELLAQQLSLAAARAARRSIRAEPLPAQGGAGGLVARLYAALPFQLTGAQQRVVQEIAADLAKPYPMHRLLQGDVGSGKTVVAAIAAAQAIACGAQVALMAPTEILAEQHFRKLVSWLQPLGVNVAWLSGSLTAKARRQAAASAADGSVQLVVGTQALIQDHVEFHRLGLSIVDEQHRFGVGQRLALTRKGEAPQGHTVPHQLNMSATPIPRTLAMTFFADLDVSVIDELPPGRTPVVTKLVSDGRRDEVIAHIAHAVREGRQAYWVCPLVEESEALQLQTAVDTYETMQAELPDLRLGLVHGRLPQTDKAAVMQAFRDGDIDLLVATTVIEVGVDVPNASLMVIEHAERFGLAQLHQLRGRVGRGSAESVCVLLYQTPLSQVARQRLRAMFETSDGFEIARRDLEQRGPGEFLGTRQSGVTLLRFADLESDVGIAEQAREAAAWLRNEYPAAVEAHLARWMRGREDFLRT